MKKLISITALLLGCALAPQIANASGKDASARKSQPKEKVCCPAVKVSKVRKTSAATVSTGSYLRRNVSRNGTITDGPSHVIVFDSDAIRNSGASNVRDFLIRRGGYR